MAERARKSGMRIRVTPVPGARRKLARPRSGRIEDIVPESSEGARLLIREARKATADKPLVLISGANLTTAAQALLLDPSIADRLVVFGANNANSNKDDSLALEVVAKKARFIAWARDYHWDTAHAAAKSPDLFPGNRLGEALRSRFVLVAATPDWAYSSYSDFGPATFLFQRKVWRSALSANHIGPPLSADLSVPAPYDFVDIPFAANDWKAIEEEFYAAVTDPAAYHPWPLSGGIEAEAYSGASGIKVESVPAGLEETAVWNGSGSWAEYQIRVDTAGTYALEIRYRADSASRLSLSGPDPTELAGVDLPAAPAWDTATATLILAPGVHAVRAQSAKGSFALDWFRIKSP
jgi:hypothetical protein